VNIYKQKIVWKRVLLVSALIIIGIAFWYTNKLVREVAQQEREQVELWAQAIQRKAKLVKYTSQLFQDLQNEELKRVQLWSEATKSLISSPDISLALKVVEANTTIPIVLLNEDSTISGHRNIYGLIEYRPDTISQESRARIDAYNDSILQANLNEMMALGNRIDVNYYGESYNYLYYKDSRLFTELKNTFNDLQVSFISEIVNDAANTPVLYMDADSDSIIASGNVNEKLLQDPAKLSTLVQSMKNENEPIMVDLGNGEQHIILYQDSALLNKLKTYPFVMFLIVGLFILIGYWLFSISRKSEQNQVWVGMSKETAHQLGTPLSSLLGWIDILRELEIPENMVNEMEKDVKRLEVITDRFSKIGAKPNLQEGDVAEVVENMVNYLKNRSSSKVQFSVTHANEPMIAAINGPLFGWVIENLCKNAVDAMNGNGKIDVSMQREQGKVIIDVSDTGKGIPPGKRKTVFEPGYTSKKRGWGLGLSLAKRIIEQYHGGRIFVKHSEVGKGTTFRIVLSS